jgi:hypothetical protein
MTPCTGINSPVRCIGCARTIRPSGRVPTWRTVRVSGCLEIPFCVDRIEKRITSNVRGLSAEVCGQDASRVTERFGMAALLGVSAAVVGLVAFVAVVKP